MKILVTGSNGLLGQKLMKLLVADGNVNIIAVARGKDRLSSRQISGGNGTHPGRF